MVFGDGFLKYKIRNWLELSVFTDNLGKMLKDGLMFDKAFDIAGKHLASSVNRRLITDLKEVFLGVGDTQQQLARYDLPQFYLALFKCGQKTGKWPKALRDAAGFMHHIAPIIYRLQRCWHFVIGAYLVCLIFKWIFLGQFQFLRLTILAVIVLLPIYSETFRYYRDWLLAKIPFIGTWTIQLALMQFFVCLEIAYDSTLNVRDMFLDSISAIDNRYLRKQMLSSVSQIDKGQSFAAALQAVPFVPGGMVAVIHPYEISGKLVDCFGEMVSQLKQIVEAKIEVVKYVSAGIVINTAVLFPLTLIMPFFLPKNMLWGFSLAMGYMMLFVPIVCARAIYQEYTKKSAGLNLWYKNLETKNLDL
ncbi:MAG: type II secretion system F family protein [Planctomycetota bacterium]